MDAEARERRQKFYDDFLATDLRKLPLRSSNLALYDYLGLFDYPGRTKLAKVEALEICQSFKAAIQAGWAADVMEINGKVGLYWTRPGGDSGEAIPPKEISDRFRSVS